MEQDLRWLSSMKVLMELNFVNDIDRVSEFKPTELWVMFCLGRLSWLCRKTDVKVENEHMVTLDSD